MLTQATHLTAQTNTAYHKMGHLIGAAKRWDISAAYCVHTSDTSITAQTNTAYHKMGHLIGAAKRWDISAAYCAHTSNTSNSTNKHSLSQDGSSDRSRQKMGHLSSILCSHKRHIYHSTNKHSLSQDGSSDRSRQKMGHLSSILCSHKRHIYCAHTSDTSITAQTNTAYHKMGHLIGAAKGWDISQHTVLTQATHLTAQTQPIIRWVRATKRWQHTVLTQATHLTHSVSQDGSEPPKDGTSQQHTVLTHPTQTQPQASHPAYHKMWELPRQTGAFKVMCPILPLMGLGLQITTPFLHCMHKTLVCFNWES